MVRMIRAITPVAMTPERWGQVEEIFHGALSRGESEREAFLVHACAGDLALRREVELLLARQGSTGGFLDGPAVAAAAEAVSEGGASLLTGRRLGTYQVHERIGSGGMGEVYRARDTKLGRDVAIKILPRLFTSDLDRLARFEREARVLASLNHPHIGAIYGLEDVDGVRALVLELVDGETLAERIAHGPIPLNETLTIARQIAEALEAAHEKGIIHRDLKPANIKVTPDGIVKVLDFGLARIVMASDMASDSRGPTITIEGTREGLVMGTAAYMSPEQARGQSVDKRTDIWAFGCVLYEMLTTRLAFDAETVSDTIAAVLEREPEWAALPAATPPSIHRLLRRCLCKDAKRRLHDISDAQIELEDALGDLVRAHDARALGSTIAVAATGHTRRRNVWISALLLLALGGAAAFTVAYLRPAVVADDATQFVVLPPDGAAFGESVADRVPSFAISPDGRRLVFLATDPSGRRALWARQIRSLTAEPLAGTEGASFPFWSPDGSFIGFFAQGKLKKVALAGGAPLTLADAHAGVGGTWNRAGVIVFSADGRGPLFRVSDAGGVPVAVTALDAERHERAHVLPQFLPDGRHFIYLVRASQPQGGVYVASLESRETKRLLTTTQKGMFAAPGYLLFLRAGTLLAQTFDATALHTSGEPVPIVESVAFSSVDGRAAYSVSESGVLAYRASGIPGTSQLLWTDRSGTRLTAVGAAGDYTSFRLSPDESVLAAELHDLRTGTGDLWLLDLKRGSTSRFTFDGSHNNEPVWSPDGTEVVFAGRSQSDGVPNLHYKPTASGSETDEPLLPSGPGRIPTDWSFDGRHILFEETHPKTRTDLWILQMPDRKPSSYLQTEFVERSGRFSPDGHWIAYVSNETGRDEVFVRSFPAASRKSQISIDGGVAPQWRRDGKELFYVSPNGTFKSVTVGTTPRFDPGPPRVLFTARIRNEDYSLSRDGQRVLLNPIPLDSTVPAPPITVVINWASALKK
jgi:eukaryotic-like serine/threonine-protein kinase